MDKQILKVRNTSGQKLCPIRYSLDLIGSKWKQPIICMLAVCGPTRYNTLKRKLNGVTNMMLAQSLKELEQCGIIHREQYNEVPPHVEYALTDRGRSIVPSLASLAEWAKIDMREQLACEEICGKCRMIV